MWIKEYEQKWTFIEHYYQLNLFQENSSLEKDFLVVIHI
jgi:hypothetical protein